MSSSPTSPSSPGPCYYYLVPNLRAIDPSAAEMDPSAHVWIQPTIIEDDDLTFGGKSLSAWYEEERRRLSLGSASSDDDDDDARAREERRGRQRFRRELRAEHRQMQQLQQLRREQKQREQREDGRRQQSRSRGEQGLEGQRK